MVEPLGRVENHSQFRGHGAMALSAPVSAPDITGAWRTITEWDSITIPGEDIALDPVAGSFTFEEQGIWFLSLFMALEFNESQQGHTYEIRLWNTTDSSLIGQVRIPVGRNQSGSVVAIPLLFEIGPTQVNDTIVFQIGEGSRTYSSVIFDSLRGDAGMINPAGITNPA